MQTNSPYDHEKLVLYLDGLLPAGEKAAIEKELSVNEDLRAELDRLVLAKDAVNYYGIQQQVSGIHQQMMKQMGSAIPVRQISYKRTIQAALAIAAGVIIVLVAWQFYSSSQISPGKLFAEQYHSYELSTVRGNSTGNDPITQLYEQKKYLQVTALYEKEQSPLPQQAFLAGVAYEETGNDVKAISAFQKVLDLDKTIATPVFKDEAEYYLALAYLRNKNYTRAIPLMQSISNDPAHLYHSKFSSSYIEKVKALK